MMDSGGLREGDVVFITLTVRGGQMVPVACAVNGIPADPEAMVLQVIVTDSTAPRRPKLRSVS